MKGELLVFHSDPGHGWLEVSLAQLTEVGLEPGDISGHSYRSAEGATFYLEEDCDAGLFAGKWEDKFGEAPDFKVWYEDDSFVRELPGIHQ